MADESIFQHDMKPKHETAIDPILHHGMYDKELTICMTDGVAVMLAKNVTYGPSWKKRGGVGAFMMLARKWDRIEKQVFEHKWDVFEAVDKDWGQTDNLLDDIKDLRNYLTLVEHEVRKRHGDF